MTRSDATARVAGLAGAAEACVVALPVATVLVSTASPDGIAAFAATWVALNGVAAAGAVRLRSTEGARIWLVAAAVGSGLILGHGNLGVAAGIALLVLLLGLRLFTRATRTDPAPSGSELWIWMAFLGAEAVVASVVPRSTWTAAAIVLTPTALALALAARAASVWSADQDPDEPGDARSAGGRLSRRLAVIPLVGSLAAVTVAGPGGPIDLLGNVVGFALRWIATLLTLVGSLVFFPIAWGWQLVVGRTSDMAGFLSRIRIQQAAELRHPSHADGSALVARVIGLAFLIAIVWAGRAIVRRVTTRPVGGGPTRHPASRGASASESLEPGDVREVRFRRQRLPRDRVRRRYAELLLVLERAGLGKEPGQTPAEYLAVVGAAYPASGEDFETVTRAYETVRYAERLPPDTPGREIDAAARRVRQAVRRTRTRPV
jgi:Domain of unknown function (DUF4129)